MAKKANVSISTVSYALNGTRSISEETKKRVFQAAEELGYQPNGIARSLKMKSNRMIAVIINSFHGPIYQEVLRGISEVATKNNYEVIASECFTGKTQVTRILSHRFVDGAIIMADYLSDETLESIASERFPIVVLDRETKGEAMTSVLIDNENAAYKIMRYFKDKGYEKIGYLGGPEQVYDSKKRFEGFTRGVRDFGLETQDEWQVASDFTEEGGYNVMNQWLQELGKDQLPRAIFSANDEMAIGAMSALQEAGVEVPSQVAIVGFDDIRLCDYIRPKLSTVRRPCYELGVMAGDNLIARLNGEKVARAVTLASELVIRESC
ncbi:MAG: LacI family DNA-binding transcriptional regulator [Cellulosilyticaceae bacterium]